MSGRPHRAPYGRVPILICHAHCHLRFDTRRQCKASNRKRHLVGDQRIRKFARIGRKVEKFTLDALVSMLGRIGKQVWLAGQ